MALTDFADGEKAPDVLTHLNLVVAKVNELDAESRVESLQKDGEATTLTGDVSLTEGDGVVLTQNDGLNTITVAADLASTTPADVASAGAVGTGLTVARADHVHEGVHSTKAFGSAEITGDVVLAGGIGITLSQVGSTVTIGHTVSTRTVYLFAEYPGVVWYDLEGAPGSAYPATDGTLETGYAGTGGRTYYEWQAAGATQVSVNGALKWVLPEEFDDWETTGIALDFFTTDDSGDASVTVEVFRNTSTVVTKSAQTTDGVWDTIDITSTDLGASWVAGDELTLEITLTSKNDTSLVVARVGKIALAFSEV
ncbi:MAG TPA: hypothetical protein PLF11_00195 [Bacillota bacterium]|nr:hypothetical protein [Dermatophilaceae bacterium]HOI35778.1 hypothetical protein [Bacillota bacterium]